MLTEQPATMAMREALWVSLQLAGPFLLVVLILGLVISLVQALTQIQEQTLAFIPKMLAVGTILIFLGPFMMGTLQGWSGRLFDQVIAVGGNH